MNDNSCSVLLKEMKEVRDALNSASQHCSDEKKNSYQKAVESLDTAIDSVQNTLESSNVSSPGMSMGSSGAIPEDLEE